MIISQTNKKNLLEKIRYVRNRTFDICETEMGDSPRWARIRSQLLKLFGDRGLEGYVHSLQDNLSEKEDCK